MAARSLIGELEHFAAPDGVQWKVGEYSNSDRGEGARCLVFQCDGVVRLVRNYPSTWRTLDPAGLLALSWSI